MLHIFNGISPIERSYVFLKFDKNGIFLVHILFYNLKKKLEFLLFFFLVEMFMLKTQFHKKIIIFKR